MTEQEDRMLVRRLAECEDLAAHPEWEGAPMHVAMEVLRRRDRKRVTQNTFADGYQAAMHDIQWRINSGGGLSGVQEWVRDNLRGPQA